MEWQYKTMKIRMTGVLKNTVDPAALDGLLNRLGKDRWELVEILLVPGEISRGEVVAVFKRPAELAPGVSDLRRGVPPVRIRSPRR